MNSWSTLAKSAQGKPVSVFLGLGALQAIAVEQIAQQPTQGPVVFLNCSEIRPRLPAQVTEVRVGAGGRIETLLDYRRCYAGLKRLKAVAARLEVAVPHVYHSLGNFMAFSLNPDALDLLPDGLLNFYDARPSDEQRRSMRHKRLVARLLGARYQPHKGNLTAMEQLEYRRQYVFTERKLYTQAREQIKLEIPVAEAASGDDLFFIDQPLDDLSDERRNRLNQAIEGFVGGDRAVLYKPHRDQINPSIQLPQNQLTVLPKTDVAEYVLQQHGASEILGIYSSALITLKIIYPEIPCTSIGFNLLVEQRPELARARAVMQDFGIRLIDVD